MPFAQTRTEALEMDSDEITVRVASEFETVEVVKMNLGDLDGLHFITLIEIVPSIMHYDNFCCHCILGVI